MYPLQSVTNQAVEEQSNSWTWRIKLYCSEDTKTMNTWHFLYTFFSDESSYLAFLHCKNTNPEHYLRSLHSFVAQKNAYNKIQQKRPSVTVTTVASMKD